MNYTSGTTGHPKGVLRPLREVDADAGANLQTWILSVFGLSNGPGAHLVNSPLYHTAVMNVGFAALHSGQTMVLIDEWDPELTLQLIERYRITSTTWLRPIFIVCFLCQERCAKRMTTAP